MFNDKLKYVINPLRLMSAFQNRLMLKMPDRVYLNYFFKKHLHYNLDLTNPLTFNEKLQWLKLYDRKNEYTQMVDKYEVKKYVADIIGHQYIIPTLGVWDSFDSITFRQLPNQFVLKCTHDSGNVFLCKEKQNFDFVAAKKGLTKSLKTDYYKIAREWPYKNVKRRIIAEKYMKNSNSEEIQDFKFMCFNGVVKCIFVCSNRTSVGGLNVTFFDTEWNRLPFIRHYSADDSEIPKPKNLKKMIELSEILSKGIPFVRCDFYNIDDNIYFGELTFFPGGGIEEFTPMEWDYKIGSWLTLPKE